VTCLLLSIILSVPTHQLETAKEQLFNEWTTSQRIANVTIGLPNKKEIEEVVNEIENLRDSTTTSTASNLTNSQRVMDVPFMFGMLDGIVMEHLNEYAKTCLMHLSELEGKDLVGIAASRVIRMRYRAAMILGDTDGAKDIKKTFSLLQYPHAEDVAVFVLADIQEAFDCGNISLARELYDDCAKVLHSKKTQYLCIPFAHGYARIAPTPNESLYGWFELAESLVGLGYNQESVDEELIAWISRLPHPPEISETSTDYRISTLALRREIAKELQTKSSVAPEKLMKLARMGDGHAAEQVLELGNTQFSEEAIELLFAYPKNVKAPLPYWQLYAARIDIKNKNLKSAMKRLTPMINIESPYGETARRLVAYIQGTQQVSLRQALDISETNGMPVAMAGDYSPAVIQGLIEQCIVSIHTGENNEWHFAALEQLLLHQEDVASSVLAEGYRLVGDRFKAAQLYNEAIRLSGPSVQTVAGLADCTHDKEAMKQVANSTSPNDSSSYWFWLSNLRLLQWFVEDGGDMNEVTAKINRLRKRDSSLGGAQFIVHFNSIRDYDARRP
jgi:hypothetical protein